MKFTVLHISKYLHYFIKSGELLTDKKGYTSVSDLVHKYRPFSISMVEILNEIKKRRISIKVYPIMDGAESIYVSEPEANIALLKLALKKLNNK